LKCIKKEAISAAVARDKYATLVPLAILSIHFHVGDANSQTYTLKDAKTGKQLQVIEDNLSIGGCKLKDYDLPL
jgi:hypothetical protein